MPPANPRRGKSAAGRLRGPIPQCFAQEQVSSALITQTRQPIATGLTSGFGRSISKHLGKAAVSLTAELFFRQYCRVEVSLQQFFQRYPLKFSLLEGFVKGLQLNEQRRDKGPAKQGLGRCALRFRSVGQADLSGRATVGLVFAQHLLQDAAIARMTLEIGRARGRLPAHCPAPMRTRSAPSQ